MNIIDIIKALAAAFIGTLLAVVQPVQGALMLLLTFAGIDIIFGILTGVFQSHERFGFRKFIMSALYLSIYLGVVVMIYTVGRFQNDTNEALYLVKIITYVFIYFYSVNILKNMKRLMPENMVIRFLDYFIGLQFMKKIDAIAGFMQHESESDVAQTGSDEQQN